MSADKSRIAKAAGQIRDGTLVRPGGQRILITGKGGVGKTTLAAFLALLYAEEGRNLGDKKGLGERDREV